MKTLVRYRSLIIFIKSKKNHIFRIPACPFVSTNSPK